MGKVKERTLGVKESRNYKRMDLAATLYGVSVALLKKLINDGKLTRYKLGTATMIDANELEKLIGMSESRARSCTASEVGECYAHGASASTCRFIY
jgi:hypothetical protein